MGNGTEHGPGQATDDTGPARWAIDVPYSEVAMHMRVAGTRMLVERRPGGMAQLFTLDGAPFSFPITAGEAGIGYDTAGEAGIGADPRLVCVDCGGRFTVTPDGRASHHVDASRDADHIPLGR